MRTILGCGGVPSEMLMKYCVECLFHSTTLSHDARATTVGASFVRVDRFNACNGTDRPLRAYSPNGQQ